MNRQIKFFLILSTLMLSGCDFENVVDSAFADRVRISNAQPPEGKVGVSYLFRITAEVKNNPNDDSFDYRFSLADGTIPPGTLFNVHREKGNDYAEISGVPTHAGQFIFAVSVKSIILEDKKENEIANDEDYPGDSPIDTDDERLYTIIIFD
ncbi:hypothetical protein P3T73_06880 [Kiritimatiellota bacterium B12222]|nr:hypothetical protein P3T73_06880 [Kiritimatiellota bacterium B12222]